MASPAETLREHIFRGDTVWMAGAYDALSAKLIAQSGFKAVFTTGYGVSASHLGEPDVELYTMTENLAVVSRIVNAVGDDVPVVADCDTGYGNMVNVRRTIRDFERAGVAAMIIEDQVSPKTCPCIAGALDILPIDEMEVKIRAAKEARRNPATLIVARTDAATMDECIRRGRAYAAAGADMIQPISRCTKTYDDLTALRRVAGVPLSLQILGWLETDLTPQQIETVAGFATFPLVPLMTAVRALQDNLSMLALHHSAADLPRPRTTISEFNVISGYEDMKAFQERHMSFREAAE